MAPPERYQAIVAAAFTLIGALGMIHSLVARKFSRGVFPSWGRTRELYIPRGNDRVLSFVANLTIAIVGLLVLIRKLHHF
jgi:hypothetical protein